MNKGDIFVAFNGDTSYDPVTWCNQVDQKLINLMISLL